MPREMVPLGRLVALCFAIAILSACGYDTGVDLPPVLERVVPSGARPVTTCGGSSGLIDEPSYSCTYLVRGEAGAIADRIARALRRDGYAVSCPRPGELAALRDDVRVTAEVTAGGSISRSGGVANVFPSGYRPEGSHPIPQGFVALDLGAIRQSEASAAFWRGQVAAGLPCDRAPVAPDPLEVCITWWNGPVGSATSETARRRRAGPGVRVVRSEHPGVSTCTYTVRVPDGFQRLIARFDHGTWIWPPLRAVARPRPFRPNARLARDGRLSLKG